MINQTWNKRSTCYFCSSYQQKVNTWEMITIMKVNLNGLHNEVD